MNDIDEDDSDSENKGVERKEWVRKIRLWGKSIISLAEIYNFNFKTI